jgi:hypothetical protein
MTRRSPLLLGFVALTLATLSTHAVSRTSPAIHGYTSTTDRPCLIESWGAILNICTTTRTLFVPVSMDSQCTVGSNWLVTAQSSSSASNVCCRTIGMENNGGISTTSFTCLSSFGSTPQTFSVFGALPYSKRVFFVCTIGPNAKVLGVDWSPNGSC